MASKTAAATASFGKKIVTSGAWKALRPFFKVNPWEIQDEDVYLTGKYRYPAPGSQGGASHDKDHPLPPAYKPPVTAASNLSKNYYFTRDARRNDLHFPEVFTPDSAKLLPPTGAETAVAAPAAAQLPPVPGAPVHLKHSNDSEYATRYL